MRLVQIAADARGAHDNQDGPVVTPPPGWAVIPEGMETPNFPFGLVEVDASDPPIVTRWTPLPIPDPEPGPDAEPSALDQLRADVDYIAMETGVEL